MLLSVSSVLDVVVAGEESSEENDRHERETSVSKLCTSLCHLRMFSDSKICNLRMSEFTPALELDVSAALQSWK